MPRGFVRDAPGCHQLAISCGGVGNAVHGITRMDTRIARVFRPVNLGRTYQNRKSEALYIKVPRWQNPGFPRNCLGFRVVSSSSGFRVIGYRPATDTSLLGCSRLW